MTAPSLATVVAGVRLPSPVLVAAGCAGSGRELHRFVDLSTIPLVTTPSLRLEPSIGHRLPDLAPSASGLVVAADRSRPGVRGFCSDELPWLASVGARVSLSVSGASTGEFGDVVGVARITRGFEAVRMIEVELAAPSLAAHGRPFAADPDECARVVHRVRGQLTRGIPMLAKLSADAVDVVETARACLHAGADGIVLLAPPAALAVDPQTLRPLAGERAGLTGPAVRPLVAHAVARVRRAMRSGALPEKSIVACGGADGGSAVVELLAAGADAVQVGSALLTDPFAVGRAERELADHLVRLAPHVRDADDAAPLTPADLVGRALPRERRGADRRPEKPLPREERR